MLGAGEHIDHTLRPALLQKTEPHRHCREHARNIYSLIVRIQSESKKVLRRRPECLVQGNGLRSEVMRQPSALIVLADQRCQMRECTERGNAQTNLVQLRVHRK